ncbi:MAG: IS200/IS605 family transposase [Chlamydiota bacterium]|nr:IS200/IS605 family transposase [Chlamydiota bacterium]
MPQSLGYSNIHIIFSTKDRLPIISPEIEQDLYSYICGICRTYNCHVYEINGMPDHIHILLEQHRTISVSELIGKIKANSSKWVSGHSKGYKNFSWQRGYGYFSVGKQQIDAVRKYVKRQKEHHKKTGFEDEVKSIYTKLKIKFDERYVWD